MSYSCRFICMLAVLLLLPAMWGCASTASGTSNDYGPDILERNTLENLVEVRLDGCTEYSITEAFGKVLNITTGVVETKLYSRQIVPDNPQESYMVWRVRIEGTDPFRLQTNVMKLISDIMDAGGTITIKGVPFRHTAAEIDLMKGLRPGDASFANLKLTPFG